MVLQRLMGRNCCIVSSLATFGTRHMRLSFRSSEIFCDVKMFLTWVVTNCPTMFQNFWKKIGCKSSDPGDFISLKEKMVALISLSVTSPEIASEMCMGMKDDVFDIGGVVRPIANRIFHEPDFVAASLANGG